jgi:hypothetical protein
MYGASAVGGTDGATIVNAPESVGRFVGTPALLVLVLVPVIVGMLPLNEEEMPPVMVGLAETEVSEAVVVGPLLLVLPVSLAVALALWVFVAAVLLGAALSVLVGAALSVLD